VVYRELDAPTLSSEDAAAILRQTLGFSQYRLENPQLAMRQNMQVYEFELMDGAMQVGTVQADVYSGQMIDFHSFLDSSWQGQQLPLEQAEAFVMDFFSGSAYDFHLEYLGLNYNREFSTASTELYSFRAVPSTNSFQFTMDSFVLYVDSRTGELIGLARANAENFTCLPLPVPEFHPEISPEQALEMFEPGRVEGLNYQETVLLRSLLSGEYELMHVYLGEAPGLYVNAHTGREDLPVCTSDNWSFFVHDYLWPQSFTD